MIALYDEPRGNFPANLIGWWDDERNAIYTRSHRPSVPTRTPDELVAFVPANKQTHVNKAHDQRLKAVERIREERRNV